MAAASAAEDQPDFSYPCIVAYDDLAEAEQQKDPDVVSEIPSLLRAAGRCIARGS